MKDRIVIAKGNDTNGTIHYIIPCKKCANKNKVYHMLWCAITCLKCKTKIPNPKHNCAGQEECYYENSESDFEVDGLLQSNDRRPSDRPYGCPCCRPEKDRDSERNDESSDEDFGMEQKYSTDPYIFYTEAGDKEIRDSSGYLLRRYTNIPKKIKFKHEAVNDYNQHLCGGWSVLPYNKFTELDRVALGLKPFGVCYSDNLSEILDKTIELTAKGLLVTYKERRLPLINKTDYIITASVNGKLGDYFDMDTLAEDYERYGINSENIRVYENVSFADFHNDKYDVESHPIEIVGLILGYPIENTISLILRDME